MLEFEVARHPSLNIVYEGAVCSMTLYLELLYKTRSRLLGTYRPFPRAQCRQGVAAITPRRNNRADASDDG